MNDELSMEDILQEIESTYPGFSDDDVIEFPIGRLKEVLHEGISVTDALRGTRRAGMPKFNIGDTVSDTFTNKMFKVVGAEVMEGDKGYEWFYRYGGYYLPESDLILIKTK